MVAPLLVLPASHVREAAEALTAQKNSAASHRQAEANMLPILRPEREWVMN